MAKITKASSNGAVVAADSFMKDVGQKLSGHHDTLMQAVVDGEEKSERLSSELEALKLTSAKELAQSKESMQRSIDEYKTKFLAEEKKNRAAFARLSE